MFSGLPPIADIAQRGWQGSFVPKAAVSRCSSIAQLFNHLVGAGEQVRRDFDAERSRGDQIDDQLEPRRLLLPGGRPASLHAGACRARAGLLLSGSNSVLPNT